VTPLFVICLALLGWELAARRGPYAGLRLPLPRFGNGIVIAAALGLVAAFAAQIALSDYQTTHDGLRPAWLGVGPLHLVSDAYRFGPNHLDFSLSAFVLVAVQVCGLFIVASGCANADAKAGIRIVPWLTGGALAVLSIASPAITSGDVFGYVGLGMLGLHPFERPEGFFHGQFAQVFAGYPIRPTIYGPVWVTLNAAIVSLGWSFLAKIVALRVFGALLLVALVALVRAAGGSRAALYALALNPMLWWQFVANAHNDLLAVVLIVGGLVAVQRRLLWVAIVLVAAAGAVKLPLLVLGVVIFARHPDRRAAWLAATASVLLAVGVSAGFGGHAYLDALVATGRGRGAHWLPDTAPAKAIGIAIVLSACGAALIGRRFSAAAGWFFPSLAPLLFPWYFAWVIPYACVVGGGLFETLIALPIAAVLADLVYGLDLVGLALLVLVALLMVSRLLRRGFAPQPA
jgi:hypothetical protein